MKIKRLILCAVSVIMLAGCSVGNSDMVDPSTVDANVLYLYDVKSNAIKAGEELSEDGSEGFWMPISNDVYAEFQDPDCVGAWSPEQYFGAKELKKGFKKGIVGFGSRFRWSTGEDGKITAMYEENYYENNNVTGLEDPSTFDAAVLYLYDVKSDAIKAGEEWSEDGSGGDWLPISDDVYAEFQDPDWIGAWSPEQYFGANELKEGFENGVIGFGSKFTCLIGVDGKIRYMYEENYYENVNVTGDEESEENNNESNDVTGDEESEENNNESNDVTGDEESEENNNENSNVTGDEENNNETSIVTGDEENNNENSNVTGNEENNNEKSNVTGDEKNNNEKSNVTDDEKNNNEKSNVTGNEENNNENSNVTAGEELGENSDMVDPSTVDAEFLYLYDVKNNAIKVGEELSEDGSGGFWMAIADDVYAEFQDPNCTDAWSPETYLSADELKEGFENGAIGFGSMFTWSSGSDGKITDMYEEGNGTGDEKAKYTYYLYDVKNGEVKVSEEWSEDGSGCFWMPISDDVYAEFQDPWIDGAWSPEQYFGANELQEGFEDGVIGFGSEFTYVIGEDGKIRYMYEESYYYDDVTGFEGDE